MSIYRLNIDSSAALQQSGQAYPTAPTPANDPPDGAPTDGTPSDQVLLSGPQGDAFHKLQLKNEQQNSAAAAIHKTDQAAQALGQKIDALKAPLETIVKNFPPFSPQDKERMRLLMSYASIRKEIDSLTFPPPPDMVKVHKELTLPQPLAKGADDSQIADHISKLDAASASLSDFRARLAAGTASVVRDPSFSTLFSGGKAPEIAGSGAPLTRPAALQVSVEVGRQFATSVTQGVTAAGHSQFLKGLS